MNNILQKIALVICGCLLLISNAYGQAKPPHHTVESTNNGYNYIFGTTVSGNTERAQAVYIPQDFITGPLPKGFITGIWFRPYNGSASYNGQFSISNFTISLGTTTATAAGTGSWLPVTVANGPSATSFNWMQGVWFELPLSTPFYYDGTSNIVVDIFGNTSTASNKYPEVDNSFSSSIIAYGNNGAPSGTIPYKWNFGLTIFPGYPCDKIPYTKIKEPKKVCPNRPFTIAPDSAFSDASYKWEYSTDGNNWANFTGSAGIYGDIVDSITQTKWYRVTITCNNNQAFTYTTPPHKVEIAPFYYCYCTNSVEKSEGNDIGNLSIMEGAMLDTVYAKNQLITGTGLPEYNNSGARNKYSSYHDSLSWPCLYRDTTYTFSVSQIHSTGSFQSGVVQGYIDFNRDGIYDPNTEKIGTSTYLGSAPKPNEVRFSFKVPLDTNKSKIGPTGLRLILSESALTGNPCDTITGSGEVEDYIIDLCNRPCNGPVPGGIIVSTDTGMCDDYEYTLTDTTYSKDVSAFSRAWQVSGDDINWFNIANTLNKDTLERVFDGQPLYYRLRTICLPTHDTAYSVSTKINAKPTYKCYCYSRAIGGVVRDSSDIGGFSIGTYSHNSGGPHLFNQLAKYPRTDYTDKTPLDLFTDSVYNFYVYHTMRVQEHGDAKVTVFMDFNNNHQYDIPEERVYTGFTSIGNHTLVDNITIPFKAITDLPTGMRVILNNDVGPNVPSDEACGGYLSGETEDFIVIFRKKWGVNIVEAAEINGFNVRPNPSNGKFFVQFSANNAVKEVKVRVTTVSGQLVKEQMYTHEGGMFHQPLDITGQPAGVYFVELNADGQKMIEKLIIN